MTSDELRSMASMKCRIAALTVDRNLASEFEDHAQTAERAADEIDQLTKLVRQNAEDLAETDTHIRTVAKRYLPAEKVDGDGYFIPPLEEIVDMLAQLIAERDALQARVAELEREIGQYRRTISVCSGSCSDHRGSIWDETEGKMRSKPVREVADRLNEIDAATLYAAADEIDRLNGRVADLESFCAELWCFYRDDASCASESGDDALEAWAKWLIAAAKRLGIDRKADEMEEKQ